MTDLLKTHPHYLFVYGTLKPGHGNNYLIQKHDGKDIGVARTVGRFLLNEGFPFVWQIRGPRQAGYVEWLGHVVGHLYKVSDVGLEACDRLEGHPRHYKRTAVPVMFGPKEKPRFATAGIYLAPGSPKDELQKPVDNLLEWGRSEPAAARNFQRRRGVST